MQGNTILARALFQQDVKHCFGIVGIPVIELGMSIQAEGINYYGFRNEQAASYAAGAVGFLTGRPGLCLVVSGPGQTNTISGMANAWSNCWPMIVIAGSSDLKQDAKEAFQECDQMSLVRPFCKFAIKVTHPSQLP